MSVRLTITIEAEHLRVALEALKLLENTPRCARYKASRKAIRGQMYAAVQRELDTDELPTLLRKQA